MSVVITLFEEINNHLMQDDIPSIYFNKIEHNSFYEDHPFTMLVNLKKTEQSLIHHPEGNVWNHTMMVVDEAAKVKLKASDARVFMWAALLHDIGKFDTTINKKGKITSYNHDKVGAEMVSEFFKPFNEEIEFVKAVTSLVRWHMQVLFVIKSMPFAEVSNMKKQVSIDDIALLGMCDRLGRTGADKRAEQKNIELFLKKMKR